MASTTDKPTPLPTIDQAASTGAGVMGTLIDAGEKATETAIIAAAPAMATPVWKQIWEGALDYIFNTFKSVFSTFTGYVIMDMQEVVRLNAADQALTALRAAITKGDQDAIDKANAAADAAAAPVLHFGGIVKP